MNVPYGYCHCGCGEKTVVSRYNDASHGYVAGEPRKYILRHFKKGQSSHMWRGGRTIDNQGYARVYTPEHPRCDRDGYVFEHVLVMEKVIGRFINPPEEIHHRNGVKDDNSPENLFLCANVSEHQKEHVRMRALAACGNADWRKCHICKQYDAPENLAFYQGGRTIRHTECYNRIRRDKRALLRKDRK